MNCIEETPDLNEPLAHPHAGSLPKEKGHASSCESLELAVDWPMNKKFFTIGIGILVVINSTLGSSLPSGATAFIADYFHISNKQQLVLPVSVFLIGYIFGPLAFGPLSEVHGRRMVVFVTFVMFTLFTLACALAPNWPALLIFRFLAGTFASAPISVVGGIFADLYENPVYRGRAIMMLMATTTLGPVLGPLISGFVAPIGWRWTFWVGLCVAGATWIPLVFLSETYAPVIRAKGELGDRTSTPRDLGGADLVKKVLASRLTRPIDMFVHEPIVHFICLFLALEYAIFYLFFEAYPLIFQGIYGMSSGIASLAFIPIGIGAVFAGLISLWYDGFLHRARKRCAAWALDEEYRRLPLACVGGIMCVGALFWLGWASRKEVHYIVPMLAGLLYGTGIELVFMALLNYLTDCYEKFAASAHAASAFSRSIFGVLLPLAADPMYETLGVKWASSLLGFLSLVMAIIPFVFIKYGKRIKARSKLCQELLQEKQNERSIQVADKV